MLATYGFAGYLAVCACHALYVLYAFTPEALLHQAGVTYYPSHYWAMALPCWLCVAVCHGYAAYEALALLGTPAPDSLRGVTDADARFEGAGGGEPDAFCEERLSAVSHRYVRNLLRGGGDGGL